MNNTKNYKKELMLKGNAVKRYLKSYIILKISKGKSKLQ